MQFVLNRYSGSLNTIMYGDNVRGTLHKKLHKKYINC